MDSIKKSPFHWNTDKGITVVWHLLFWVVLNGFYYQMIRIEGWEEHFWFYIGWLLPVDLTAVYFTTYFLVPRFLLRKQYTAFAITFLSSVVLFVLVERAVYYYILYPVIFPPYSERPFFFFSALLSIFMGMYSFVFLFVGIRLFRTWIQGQKRQVALEKQSMQSELALLRAQVNPHFLFNTINNIDSLVFTDQQKASDSLVRLSDIMRYMLYEANTDYVPLQREVLYLESMIDLLRLRLKDPQFIACRIDGDPSGKYIPPMLLVPFIENAYKHGLKSGPMPGIIIDFTFTDIAYSFTVKNYYDHHTTAKKDKVGGIGLANVRRRLTLLYPNNHQFDIQKTNHEFTAHLKVPAHKKEVLPRPTVPNPNENQCIESPVT
ncbi:MAG: sensor histidine kinase [Saprospiraceae bacterium]|nr:sensor histidine kinase [Saprospiraceae bacterium]